MKPETPHRPQPRFNCLSSFAILAALALAAPGCKVMFSKAKASASNVTCGPGVGVVDGEPDAGVNVSVVVRNTGEQGFININPELSTSEGEWSRSQDLHFDAGQTQKLTYFFAEPTINARNIQCRVAVSPDAGK